MQENDNKLYYSISEVAEKYNIRPSTLHFWEKQFTNLKPKRNKKGNRFYTKENLELIDKIYFLVKKKGYTLKGAKDKINEDANSNSNAVITNSLIKIKELLIELKSEIIKK